MRTYFIQASAGPIKIGRTTNVSERLATLSSASHEPLTLLGTVEGNLETECHTRFGEHRIRGEWFRPSAALLAFISEHCTPHDGDTRRCSVRATRLHVSEDAYLTQRAKETGFTPAFLMRAWIEIAIAQEKNELAP